MSVLRQHLQIFADEDVSMLSHKHPLVGKRCAVAEGAGDVVYVSSRGRVQIALDDTKRKSVFVDLRDVSFEDNSASTAEAPLPQAEAPLQQADLDFAIRSATDCFRFL